MTSQRPPPRPDALHDEAIAQIGGYTIVKKLGEGGAGKVFACRDEGLGRLVAIKTLHPRNARDQQQKERFLREARAMARVTSAHVVGIHQVGENKGGPYIIMEYLPGTDLETRLKKSGPLDATEAVDLIRQVAQGLSDADRAGIVHRDVKPANIIVTDGKAKLTDFGLARPLEIQAHVTTEGTFTGTAAFLAPERARGEPDDKRGDIYALGCTLYSLISGEPPFVRATPIEVIGAHLAEDALPLDKKVPSCPRGVALLVAKMMEKDPAARPQTYAALDGELARLLPTQRRETNPIPDDDDEGGYQAQPTGVMGSLKQMGVIEIAQMLELQKKTAIVSVHPRDEDIAEICIEGGQLVGATFGALEGDEAFIAVTTRRDGLFRIFYERPPTTRNLKAPLSFLILEALRRADEAARTGKTPTVPTASAEPRAKPKDQKREPVSTPARSEAPLAHEPPPPPIMDDGPTRVSPRANAAPLDVPLADAPTMARARVLPSGEVERDEAAVPAFLSPLDDETVAAALSGDDHFVPGQTAIVDRPQEKLEQHDDLDDDESMLDRTAEHPAPIAGLSLDDRTEAMPMALPSRDVVDPEQAAADRTLLVPVMFSDDDDVSSKPSPLDAVTKVARATATRVGALTDEAQRRLPALIAFAGTPRGRVIIGVAITTLLVLIILVGALTATPAVDVKAIRRTFEKGDAAAASARVDEALDKADLDEGTRAALLLLRADIAISRGDTPLALAALKPIAKGGHASRGTVDHVVALLVDEAKRDAARDLLVDWKSDLVDDALLETVERGEYAARNEAWRVLDERGATEGVDREAMLIKNLDDGPTCRERRNALLSLIEVGAKSTPVRRAVERASARGRDNVCMERELSTLIPR